MSDDKKPKKDLTSILDLAGQEGDDAPESGQKPVLPVPSVEQLTEQDFGNLEELPPSEDGAQAPEIPTAAIPLAMTVATPEENPMFSTPDIFPQTEAPAPPAEPAEPEPEPEPAPLAPQDLTAVREFGERLAIGSPQIEASPPYSLLARGTFDEKCRKQIASVILGEESLGIRPDELAIQLEAGKILVPRVSEFAAIVIALRIRDVVDDIRIGPAAEIYRAESPDEDEPPYIQRDQFRPNQPLIKK